MKKEIQKENFLPVKEIKTRVKNGLTVLVDPKNTKKTILALVSGITEDISVTNETLVVSRELLKEVRQTRFALANISKANQSTIRIRAKEDKDLYDEFIDILKPKEDILKDAIKVIEDEKKAEKERKILERQIRVQELKDKVSDLRGEINKKATLCKTDEDYKILTELVSTVDESWIANLEEFAYMGEALQDDAKYLLEAALKNVENAKEAERLRVEAEEKEKKRIKEEKIQAKEKERMKSLAPYWDLVSNEIKEFEGGFGNLTLSDFKDELKRVKTLKKESDELQEKASNELKERLAKLEESKKEDEKVKETKEDVNLDELIEAKESVQVKVSFKAKNKEMAKIVDKTNDQVREEEWNVNLELARDIVNSYLSTANEAIGEVIDGLLESDLNSNDVFKKVITNAKGIKKSIIEIESFLNDK